MPARSFFPMFGHMGAGGVGGDDTPVTPPSGTAMPATAPAGWTRAWGQDFNIDCARGNFLNTYYGAGTFNAAAAAAGNGLVNAYPTSYHDTRSKHTTIDGKYGVYDPGGISVSGGVMAMHIWWDAALGQMRVCAPVPKIAASGWGYLGSSRRTIRARCVSPLNTIKVAWLDWPQNNSSTSNATAGVPNGSGGFIGGDGENDFPEQNLDGTDTASLFMHKQNATSSSTGSAKQYGVASAVDLVDGSNWHTFTTERIVGSYSGGYVGQSFKAFVDGVQVGVTQTSGVPMTPMRWVWQTETIIGTTGYNTPLDQTVDGIVEVDWATVDVP